MTDNGVGKLNRGFKKRDFDRNDILQILLLIFLKYYAARPRATRFFPATSRFDLGLLIIIFAFSCFIDINQPSGCFVSTLDSNDREFNLKKSLKL